MKITTKQQIENAIKWIEALLSGKYKQGKEKLGNQETGFCCWGLGCYITDTPYDYYNGWNDVFYKKVGFIESNGGITPNLFFKDNLAIVNDDTEAGFKRIGKYLIKHADTNFLTEVAVGIKEHFKHLNL